MPRRSHRFEMRLDANEKRHWRDFAEGLGLTSSELVRKLVNEHITRTQNEQGWAEDDEACKGDQTIQASQIQRGYLAVVK